EGVLLDPIGAIVAVVTLEIVLAETSSGAAAGLLGLPSRLGLGLLMGAVGGYLLARILRAERLVPAGLENVFTLAMVLALFEITNAIKPDTGILAVTVAGMIVGNLESRIGRELREFKEQLTLLLVGMLFVVLAADVELERIVELGWGGVAAVLALMLVVRPLGVWASTAGTDVGWQGRAFIAWIGPRGIVAAAVASLFARRLAAAGSGYGDDFRALVFLVIGATVVIQGLSAGWVAERLGVRRRSEQGFAIVGANPVARAVARLLAKWGEEVVLVDSNPMHTADAENEGFSVIYGNANEEPVFLRADVAGRRGFIACTPNEGVNVLLAERARREHRVPESYVLVRQETAGVTPERAADTGARILFGTPVDFDAWAHALRSGEAETELLTFAGEAETPLFGEEEEPPPEERSPARLAVVVRRGEAASPVSDRTVLRPDDTVAFLVQPGAIPAPPPPGRWRAEEPNPSEDRLQEIAE
ncbi:MAG TPA: cation:proton antiporter, partial [Longimicrobiaceae bacterium]|nr:cation:proton antiporter [Longimicrobiaceae bacterium]